MRLYLSLLTILVALDASTANAADRHMPTSIGEFWLGQKVSEARGLTELTPAEYLAFANSGWVRAFRDERIFKGPDRAPFQGAFWNLMVGTTGGRIFKLSLQKVTYDPTPRSGELFLRMRENTLLMSSVPRRTTPFLLNGTFGMLRRATSFSKSWIVKRVTR